MKVKADKATQHAESIRNNDDPYGRGILSYATRWADMMEAKVDAGASVADIAERTSNEADTDGITGFMYGAAVGFLKAFWEHGDELARWHNRKYLPPDEADAAADAGKTVNPAVMTIGV